jgi:Nitrile hydratase, alpha chain
MVQQQLRQELAEGYKRVLAQTWQDEAFKQRLVADPRAALQEQGLPVPDGKAVRVVEDTAEMVHLVLPAKPAGDLSDEQLARIAGEPQDPRRILGRVVIKAWQDEAFKRRLVADPRAVLEQHGLPPPNGKAVRVVENTADTVHLVLSCKPAEGELTDDQLEQVAGGLWGLAVVGAAMLVAGIAMDSDFDWHSWG